MPEVHVVDVPGDVITVIAARKKWQGSGVGPVIFGITSGNSGFDYETHLPQDKAEELHEKLGLAIDEAKREAAGDE